MSTTDDAQGALDEIGPTIAEMQEGIGGLYFISIRYVCTCSDFHTISILCLRRWDDITLDLTSIEDFTAKEEATMLQIIAELDDAQIRERWQRLGDVGMSCLSFVVCC